MSWIKGYSIPFKSQPSQDEIPDTYPKTPEEDVEYNNAIKKLLDIGAICNCNHNKDEFISSVFLIPKSNGQKRFILNLKKLNKFIQTHHFKMEDYRTASKLISKNCFMASIDLKDAYFLVNIQEPDRKYLRFKYRDLIYQFSCLPFGLCTAPYVFTKLLKPVMECLRSKGILCVIYLDDILCFGQTYMDCQNNVQMITKLLQSLGFILNEEKSCLIPSRNCRFLGFNFNSTEMILELPLEKRQKIKHYLQYFIDIKKCNLHDFTRLIGLLISACPALEYSWLYTKKLEHLKYIYLFYNPNYNQSITITRETKSDMIWWLNNVDKGFHKFKLNKYEIEIYSDASRTGWGAYCNGKKSYGFWTEDERRLHINELELKAALFGLKIFANNFYDCEILLRIDNTTAISCLNRMGSVQYPHLNEVSREIWQWCESKKIHIFASYISSKDNYEADALSRMQLSDTEWELGDYAFDEVINSFGIFDVDLFASRSNAKCDTYVTWKCDPNAWKIDAFTFSWNNLYFYAFPPFALILKMLRKIVIDEAEGVVIVPYWPTQAWYPLFKRLVRSKCITFDPNINLLKSPFRRPHHLHSSLCLLAARLSGKPT